MIRSTYTGYANLDGSVNTADFTRLATHFNATTQLWSDGDFNYDGKINALDFNAIATSYGTYLAPDAPPSPPALRAAPITSPSLTDVTPVVPAVWASAGKPSNLFAEARMSEANRDTLDVATVLA